jgi:hypothetical protein
MPRWYADTSSALKLVLEEAESGALAAAIDENAAELVGTRLLETEMRRAAHRVGELSQDRVTALLATFDLYSVNDAVFRQAGLLPGQTLRSLDALHMASAIALNVDAVVTYDVRLAAACAEIGVPVLSPA